MWFLGLVFFFLFLREREGDFSFLGYSPINFPVLYVVSQISVPGTDIRLFEMEVCFLIIYFSDLHFPSSLSCPK